MSIQKPSKPDVTLPDNFGGTKTPYSEAQIRDGYLQGVPEIVDGGNINYEKDALFQKIKYCEAIADAINGILPNNTIAVDSNNRFTYTTQVQMATDEEFQAGTSELKVPNVKQTKDESSRIMAVMNTKANDDNVIHKSGDETITGYKRFHDGSLEITASTAAPTIIYHQPGAYVARFGAYKDIGGFGAWNGDFSTYLPISCASSNQLNTAVTTVSISSGYVRFGNGLQICWGIGGAGTVTLPVPFANTNYQVTTSQVGGGHTYNCGTDNYTTTSFNITNYQAHWIAIGYWY